MFEGINLRNFLNTPEEWHSFLIGFFEVLCPWPSRCYIPKEQRDEILAEYHYYSAGRGLGFITLLLILIGLCKLIETLWR